MKDKTYRPKIASDWKLLFKPQKYGNYVNDHCIVKHSDGTWHLFGITGFGNHPSQERYFVHAKSNELISNTPMEEVEKVIDNGTRAWAPGIIEHKKVYYMYYGPSPTKLDVSYDLSEWMGYEIKLSGVPVFACHRDHMVIKLDDNTWVMYVSGVFNEYGCISCLVSNDLLSWRFVGYALTSEGNAPLRPAWGAFESPFVVKYKNKYYLFTTYTNTTVGNYQDTLVFCSDNPFNFGVYNGDNHNDVVVAQLKSHAGEVIYDEKTQSYYITTCGIKNFNIPIEGAVAIAKLEWE